MQHDIHTHGECESWYIKDRALLSPYNINLYILLWRTEPPLIRHKELSAAAGCASFRLSSLSAAHTPLLLLYTRRLEKHVCVSSVAEFVSYYVLSYYIIYSRRSCATPGIVLIVDISRHNKVWECTGSGLIACRETQYTFAY